MEQNKFESELFDAFYPNRIDDTKPQPQKLVDIAQVLSDKHYDMKVIDFETKFIVDMSVEENEYGVFFTYEFSLRSKLPDDAYFSKRKNEVLSVRRGFSSATDLEALELLAVFNKILPKR